MNKIYIGIDNGVTGTIGIITPKETLFFCVPTKKEQSYTKTKQSITRVDTDKLKDMLTKVIFDNIYDEIICKIERPMVNPRFFKASVSAVRALEATQIVLEELRITYSFIDSKEWQKACLPHNVIGAKNLKKASLDIGNKFFLQFKNHKHGDRDGLLIAEYLRGRGQV